MRLLRCFVILFAIALAGSLSPYLSAQGTDNEYGQYSDAGCSIEVYTQLSIDESMGMYAYTEADVDLDSECSPYDSEAASELNLFQNSDLMYTSGSPSSESFSDPTDSHDYWGEAQGGYTYIADGVAYLGYTSYYGEAPESYFDYVGDVYASVSTESQSQGLPQVDTYSPQNGTVGDSQVQIQFAGSNLLNSDGSLPTFTTYPSSLHLTAQSNSTASDLYATYSIDQGTTPQTAIIDITTDGGTSDDINFWIYEPDASITSIDPSTWTADGSPFQLTITGTNFGSSPTVAIDSNDIQYNSNPSISTNGSQTTLTTTVTVPTTETATQVTVTVIPGTSGCTGNCYQMLPAGQGGGSQPANPPAGSVSITGACPASVTYNATLSDTMSLDPNVPNKWLTGVGIIAAMQVGPSSSDFKGAQISESLSTASNSCPLSFGFQCGGSATFTVGSGDTMVDGTPEPARKNVFYDQHYTVNSQNDLAAAGISSCTSACTQTYSCGGKPIGSFTVTRDYEPGTINGYAVTNVNVSKQ